MHHEVEAITDSQHGLAHCEHTSIGLRSIRVVDRRGSARQDDADRRIAVDFVEGRRTRQDHGENVLFTDAARNKLGVLRTKVENDDGLGFH